MAGPLIRPPASAPAEVATPTPAEWRKAMGRFASGVTIVTSWDQDAPIGTTVSAFCSLSLEPPLLLVCLDHINPALKPLERCGRFGINILGEGAGDIALRFARGPGARPFDETAYRASSGAPPQLDAAPVFIDCWLEHSYAGGDHQIIVGRGVRIEHASSQQPLLYHKGRFLKLD